MGVNLVDQDGFAETCGGGGGSRGPGELTSPWLSALLSNTPLISHTETGYFDFVSEMWRARQDSNLRPSVPKTDALSAELRAHGVQPPGRKNS